MRRGRGRREGGSVLVLVALLSTALFVVAALVVDLSLVRQNRQAGKRSSDLAAAAGVRVLDNGFGDARPWSGICAARDFLIANDPTFTGMAEVYRDGNGNAISGDPCTALANALCVASVKSTWGALEGFADGGRLRVTIRSGYALPDPVFAEDTQTAYSTDAGSDPCLQLAVMVEEREDAQFGGVAGAASHETRVRSVSRAHRTGGDLAAALILLERTRCQVLTVNGTTASIEVRGRTNNAPGSIHADSLASDGACADNRKIFDVDGSPSLPAIRAFASADGLLPGLISSVSLTAGDASAKPEYTADSPQETCVQEDASHCVLPASISGGPLLGRTLVTRSVVDSRYLSHVRVQRQRAIERFGWDATEAEANGFTVHDCNHPGSFTADIAAGAEPKVFVDCGGGQFNGTGKSFPDGYEVVVDGYVRLGGTLDLGDETTVYIEGRVGGSERAVALQSPSDGIQQNVGSSADCDGRHAAAPTARSTLVVGKGSFFGTQGTVRLCQTTVLMLDERDADCEVPSLPGQAPMDNSCSGQVDFSGSVVVDWSAPNATDAEPDKDDFALFEDLGLWSETQANQSVQGGGGLSLAGIFFTPNADPFTLGGGGSIDLLDAQFVTRRLLANGGGTLTLSPQGPNAVKLPELAGFTLVR